jgi:hypothetical protein
MSSMMKIPVIMCIDVEPDDREIDVFELAEWTGFVESYHFFSQLRPELERTTGSPARLNWFLRMDPQIEHVYNSSAWVVERYAKIFRELESAGDELGLHTHPWRWDERSRRWVADHGNQEWVDHCVRISFEAFHRALGRPCRSFRFGDHWMNNETMRLLEELGAQFDLTIEPGCKAPRRRNRRELVTGYLPDCSGIKNQFYRPSKSNFKEPALVDWPAIQIIPLSTAKPGRPTLGRSLSIKRVAKYCLSAFRDPMQLNPCFDVQDFCKMMDSILYLRKDLYLAPVLSVDSFIKPQKRYNLEQNFKYILNHPLAEHLTFVTPGAAIESLST